MSSTQLYQNQIQQNSKISVKFQLKFDVANDDEQNENQLIQQVFVLYQDQNEKNINFINSEMELDNKNNIWFANIEINSGSVYKYCYKIQQKNKLKQESQNRWFKYDEKEKIAIDEWNRVWCLYRYQVEDPQIMEYFQIKIKDFDKKSYQSIDQKNSNIPGITYQECSETLKFSDQQKRQFAFIYKNNQDQVELSNQFDPRKGNSFINNFVVNKFNDSIFLNGEQLKKIQLFMSTKQNVLNQNEQELKKQIQELENQLNMKSNLVNQYRLELDNQTKKVKEFQAKDQDLQERLKQFQCENRQLKDAIVENQKEFDLAQKQQQSQLEDRIIKYLEEKDNEFQQRIESVQNKNKYLLKQQQEKMEEDLKSLQKKSQEVINNYIQRLEEANQKIGSQEFQCVHFECDDIRISLDQSEIPDEYQQNIHDLEQTIQSYKNIESNLKKEKDQIELYYSNKYENAKQGYQNRYQQLIQKGEECQQQLDKFQSLLKEKIKESDQQKQGFDDKVEKYKIALKKLKQQLDKKSDELEIYIKAIKELQEKLEKEQEKNHQLQQELKNTIESSEKRRQVEFDNCQKVHDDEIKQLKQQQQQQFHLEKQLHEEKLREQQLEQKQLLNEIVKTTYQRIGDEILDPYFKIQQIFHKYLIDNFKSQIETVIKENIANFETPVNYLQNRLSQINGSELNESKRAAFLYHENLVNAIQQFKEDQQIKNAELVKESFAKFNISCNRINEIAMKIFFSNNQEGEQIQQLIDQKIILDQKLDSCFRMVSFSNDISQLYQQFENDRNAITKVYYDFQKKHLRSIE